jgi:hypothetical protein
VDGVVVDLSSTLVLVHLLSDRADFDGFSVLRVPEIEDVRGDFVGKRFFELALRMQKISAGAPAGVRLDSMANCLSSAQRAFPLLCIEQESRFPGEAQIGRAVMFREGLVKMRLVSSEAQWLPDECWIALNEISRVGFGGAYESALALVAGAP